MKSSLFKPYNVYVLSAFVCVVLAISLQAALAATAAFDPAAYARADTNGRLIIHLPVGVYAVPQTINLPSDTVLEGEGATTVLERADGFVGSRFISNRDFYQGNRNVTVRNLKVRFAGRALTGDAEGILRFHNVDGVVISNVVLDIDSPAYAIDLSGQVRNASIESCTISNLSPEGGGAIMIRNSDRVPALATENVIVRRNTVSAASDEPIAAFGWEGAVSNVLIEENSVTAQGASFGITVFGIDNPLHHGQIQSVRVANNRIRGSRVGGIGIKGGAQALEVIGNTIEDTKADGIFLHSGGDSLPGVRDVVVRQNTVLRAGRHCIFATGAGLLIDANRLSGCAQAGIYSAGTVSVSNNQISDAAPGILVYGGNRDSIRNNSLSNAGQVLFLDESGSSRQKVSR